MKSSPRISKSFSVKHGLWVLVLLALLFLGWVTIAQGLQNSRTMTVNSTADESDADLTDGVCDSGQGVCTLRAALEEANARSERNRIVFDIPGIAPHTITIRTPLPHITDPVDIDGTTQAGFAGTPVIELDGLSAGDEAAGLQIAAGGSTVRGLVINRFEGSAIVLRGEGSNRIAGNFIGTDTTGTKARGNGIGLLIDNTAENVIGGNRPEEGNVIAGNRTGIYLYGQGAYGNRVLRNWIGTNATGDALPNWHGLRINNAPENEIGGWQSDAGNVIAGNEQGVVIYGSEARGNKIVENTIGAGGDEMVLGRTVETAVFQSAADNNAASGLVSEQRETADPTALPNQLQQELQPGAGEVAEPAERPNPAGRDSEQEGKPEKRSGSSAAPVSHRPIRKTFSKNRGQELTGHAAETRETQLRQPAPAAILRQAGTTFVVNATGDGSDADTGDGLCDDGSGVCTLRAAIMQANALAGADTITFNIPGAGAHTIQPATALPKITDPVTIDATTQAGYTSSTPMIELNGYAAGAGSDGLKITAGSSAVRGLIINGFDDAGIELRTGGGNVIAGNFVGTDASGSGYAGNFYGILLVDSSNNMIGGTGPGSGNLISGNLNDGLLMRKSAANNVVQGNYIGTNWAGTAALGNGDEGIQVKNGTGNVIGGTAVGAGNIIAGNGDDGISLASGAHSTSIQGNTIGLNAAGTAAIGNGGDGIQGYDAAANTIGGTVAGSGNIVSGNGSNGIKISASTMITGNVILGNYVGTGAGGLVSIGNGSDGIELYRTTDHIVSNNIVAGSSDDGIQAGESLNLLITGNLVGTNASGTMAFGNGDDGILLFDTAYTTIGGAAAADRNLVSGSGGDGIDISGNTVVTGNVILNNFIGTDVSGTTVLGNGDDGIDLWNVTGHTIDSNLVSGSGDNGIQIGNTTHSLLTGNLVGVDASGTYTLGNGYDGITLWESAYNTIGGATAAARNLIAGSGDDGVEIGSGRVITGNLVLGNYIGTNISGTAALGNGDDGIDLWRVTDHTISNNLISGNGDDGVDGGASSGLHITGNLVGTDSNGTAVLGNGDDGLTFWETGFSTIGGSGPQMRNLVSGNGDDGVDIGSDSVITGNLILHNYIGTNISGTAVLGNGDDGIDLWNVTGHTIDSNLVSGSGDNGIQIGSTTHSLLTGNLVGVDASGTYTLGNGYDGITLWESAGNTIGGATTADRNLIAGSGDDGIDIGSDTVITGNVILHNYIGTNISGTAVLGNGDDGIDLWNAAYHTISNNLVSGSGDDGIEIGSDTIITGNVILHNHIGTNISGTAVLGNGDDGIDLWRVTSHTISDNLISGNGDDGIDSWASSLLLITGNLVGTDISGVVALGNGDDGIRLSAVTDSAIGGTEPGAANVIAHSGDAGIYISDSTSTGNAIRANHIWDNGGLGIDLSPYGVTANDNGDGDTGPNNRQNFPDLTAVSSTGTETAVAGNLQSAASTSFALDFFSSTNCDSSGYGEGQKYLGSTNATTNVSGTAAFAVTFSTGNLGNTFVTATATDPGNNTSEYSLCFQVEHVRSWQLISTATAPPVTGEHVMAYDEGRQVVVLYGGNAGGWPYENSTWEFDGTDWALLPTVLRPAAVYGAAMVYDQSRGVMVLFGGSDAFDTALNETWEFDGAGWTEIVPAAAPPPRAYHDMVYDTATQRVILFGGQQAGVFYDDTWAYDGVNWVRLTPAQLPPARALHAMAYDASSNQVLLFGGVDATGTLLADFWSFDTGTATWSQVAAAGPAARQAHGLVYDAAKGNTVLVGGANNAGDTSSNDVWHYQSASGWVAANPPPVPVAYHRIVYDTARQLMLIFVDGETWQYR